MPRFQANAILSRLSAEELAFLAGHMKLVSLKKGEVIFEPGGTIDRYYFPSTCALELAIDLADGKGGATTVINMNSMYPLHLIGEVQSQHRATVCSPGQCYTVPAWVIHKALRRMQSLLWIVLQESIRLFEMAALESVCLRNHTLEQITAKLILLSMDNGQSPIIRLTHQEMANSVGARREGVTGALKKFKGENLIATRRGSIEVLNRKGLEQVSCECYKSLSQIRHATFNSTDTP